ncbi:hypothetical protein RIF29_26912 [Crotalaria pallida]|uniref:tRNA-intron lyase n=1 Tax=Crotalaria pallida TaxID=3830 RepID=A0AAN9EP61_CROPI
MSKIISQLQSFLVQSEACRFLSDNSVHLAMAAEQIELLDKGCFGQPGDNGVQSHEELWTSMKSKKKTLPYFYKAYSHLRMRNWVVRSGTLYGVDFVVYRHHPARVHSEYDALVLSHEDDEDLNERLRVWYDVHCTTRLLGGVAKILLTTYLATSLPDIGEVPGGHRVPEIQRGVERGAGRKDPGGTRLEDYPKESTRWYVVVAENATGVGTGGGGVVDGQAEKFVPIRRCRCSRCRRGGSTLLLGMAVHATVLVREYERRVAVEAMESVGRGGCSEGGVEEAME